MDAFDRVKRANVRGSVDLACQVLPYWTKTKAETDPDNLDAERGCIVLVSSMVAFECQAGASAYTVSKAGIAGLVLPMARDIAQHGIRVVAIAPGIFKTPMGVGLPQEIYDNYEACTAFPRRAGIPAEFGSLARHCFENTYLNGEWIRLDGGNVHSCSMSSWIEVHELIIGRVEDASWPAAITDIAATTISGSVWVFPASSARR